MFDTFAALLDWFGIVVFTTTGALVASRKQMDLVGFVLLGAYASGAATLQYRRVVRSLRPVEIPDGYNTHGAEITSLAIAALAVVLSVYLFATR